LLAQVGQLVTDAIANQTEPGGQSPDANEDRDEHGPAKSAPPTNRCAQPAAPPVTTQIVSSLATDTFDRIIFELLDLGVARLACSLSGLAPGAVVISQRAAGPA